MPEPRDRRPRRPAPPWIKICGVTRVDDAELAVQLGADLLGLNFHPPSPRCLTLEAAEEIAAAVRGRTRLVGVFVNRPAAEIADIADRLGLDRIQFHGDETPAEIAPLADRAIVAVRLDEEWRPEALESYGAAWGFLFEARHRDLYGGTGASWPYERLAGLGLERPFLVAGGIGPENAGEALSRSGAWGVDVCSGVESRPGLKDPGRMRRLFEEVRHAAREA